MTSDDRGYRHVAERCVEELARRAEWHGARAQLPVVEPDPLGDPDGPAGAGVSG